ncbi:MAG: transposase [Desulfurobacteriaceae bacterium]
MKSWKKKNNWEELMAYFKYPFEMRGLMYTTNIIESHNSKFRKATDRKRVFSSDQFLLESLYLVVVELEKKWSRSAVRN